MITFYSSNLVNQSVISSGNENALFPLDNLKDARRSKVYRSIGNTSSIVFDFGTPQEVDSFFIVDNPRAGFGISSATLQFNSTDAWTSPAFSEPILLNHSHGVGVKEFSAQSFRYARLVVSSSIAFCELVNLFIGKKISFDSGIGIDLGWSYKDKDLSVIKENRYGQKFIDIISRQKQINFSLNSLNKDELDQVLEVYDTNSITYPFFVSIGNDEMINDKDRFAGMFFLDSIPGISNKSFGLYDISLTIEEAM